MTPIAKTFTEKEYFFARGIWNCLTPGSMCRKFSVMSTSKENKQSI